MSWQREGQTVSATYCGHPVSGMVRESRVMYGGRVQHTLDLTVPLSLPWRANPATTVLIEEKDISG